MASIKKKLYIKKINLSLLLLLVQQFRISHKQEITLRGRYFQTLWPLPMAVYKGYRGDRSGPHGGASFSTNVTEFLS